MSSTFEDIQGRRSIRSFEDRQLSKEDLSKILEAGIAAPSSRNLQPWHFTVVQDKDFLDNMVNKNREIVLANPELTKINPWVNVPGYHNFYQAPTVIVISGNKENPWHVCDCALAMENMSLAAWTLGIGSCIIVSIRFAFREADVVGKLDLPENHVPLYALSLGYIKGEIPPMPERNKDCMNYV